MALVDRTAASSTIPEDYARGIIKNATQMSAAMSLFPRKRMRRKQQRMSVIGTKPTASFVTGSDTDVGLKAATNMTFDNLYLNAEPVAGVVVMSEDVLEDSDYDLWAEIKPELEEAVAVAVDAAVFFGTGAPSTWPTPIVTAAVAAGNTVNVGTGVDLAADLITAKGLVLADGFYPDGWYYSMADITALEGLRDANRQFLFSPKGPANTGVPDVGTDPDARRRSKMGYQGRILQMDAYTSALGLSGFASVSGNARFITGDFTRGMVGVRSDIKYQILREATIYNPDGSVMIALAQQDAVALRFVMRVAFQMTNPPTRMNTNSATRYPFAVARVP